jgi:hypothetical protein
MNVDPLIHNNIGFGIAIAAPKSQQFERVTECALELADTTAAWIGTVQLLEQNGI